MRLRLVGASTFGGPPMDIATAIVAIVTGSLPGAVSDPLFWAAALVMLFVGTSRVRWYFAVIVALISAVPWSFIALKNNHLPRDPISGLSDTASTYLIIAMAVIPIAVITMIVYGCASFLTRNMDIRAGGQLP